MNDTEWVVTYWTPERKEFRCSTRADAMNFAMNLSPRCKVFVDEVNFGDQAVVR